MYAVSNPTMIETIIIIVATGHQCVISNAVAI